MSDETNVPATTAATGAPSTKTPEPAAKPAAKKTEKSTKPKVAQASKPEPTAKMVLRITAKPWTGFRRCGVHHPAEPIDYPADAFDAQQIAILKDDPSLVVEEL